MPAVVSDTSVIHFLAAIGQADLLHQEFGQIFVPPAVWRELHAKPNLPGALAADTGRAAGWLIIQSPQSSEVLQQLFNDLDPGEAEAIALACELKSAMVLLDEADGRAEGVTVLEEQCTAKDSGHDQLTERAAGNHHKFAEGHEQHMSRLVEH